MVKIAIQENLLPGASLQERLSCARDLGFAGVEFAAADLDARIDDIFDELEATGLRACGVHMGTRDGWLSADMATREAATDALRSALTCALDLEADYVSFVPQYGAGDLPDLTPFASPRDLGRELLVWLLRGASDLADAMETALAMQPVNRNETTFLTRLDQAAMLRHEAGDHAMITIAANTWHMSLEEEDMLAALADHIDAISVVYLAGADGGLPAPGPLPFPAIGALLADSSYAGWLTLGSWIGRAPAPTRADLRACCGYLRACRLVLIGRRVAK